MSRQGGLAGFARVRKEQEVLQVGSEAFQKLSGVRLVIEMGPGVWGRGEIVSEDVGGATSFFFGNDHRPIGGPSWGRWSWKLGLLASSTSWSLS